MYLDRLAQNWKLHCRRGNRKERGQEGEGTGKRGDRKERGQEGEGTGRRVSRCRRCRKQECRSSLARRWGDFRYCTVVSLISSISYVRIKRK